MINVVPCIAALLSAFLLGCAEGDSKDKSPQGQDVAMTTGTSSSRDSVAANGQASSCLNIVGGNTTSGHNAVVLLLVYDKASNSPSTCTGTYVGSNVIATAAHCIPKDASQTFRVFHDKEVQLGPYRDQFLNQLEQGLKAKAFVHNAKDIVNDKWGRGVPSWLAYTDLAFVIMDDTVKAPGIVSIAGSTPETDLKATLVGFGKTTLDWEVSSESSYHRQEGFNRIKRPEDYPVSAPNTLILTSSSVSIDESIGAPGDSGGPLLVNNEIVGIASAALPLDGTNAFSSIFDGNAMNLYARLTSDFARTLMEDATLQGADFAYGSPAQNNASQATPNTCLATN